jgi:sugar (pentulose or hexulose) kinase
MIKLLIGLDVGTTNIKAGLFDTNGRLLKVASRPTITQYTDGGLPHYDPEWMWETAAAVLGEAAAEAGDGVRCIGITSMAEAGLIVDLDTGKAKSHVIPWFDKRSLPQLERLKAQEDPLERFSRSGLNPSFKYGMLKLMWLKDQDASLLNNACWLSVSDYIAFRLTGERFTDASLAARTYAYDLRTLSWDELFLEKYGLGSVSFPTVLPA